MEPNRIARLAPKCGNRCHRDQILREVPVECLGPIGHPRAATPSPRSRVGGRTDPRGSDRRFDPPPDLASRGDAFWSHAPVAAADPVAQLRVLPDGCVDLIAHFRAGPGGFEPIALTSSGPTDRPRLVGLPAGLARVGVRSRAGLAGPLLDIPPLDLFRRDIAAIAGSPRFSPLLDRRAIELIERCRGTARVAAVARLVGAGERALRREVERAAGLTPKALARICRFQAAWSALGSDPGADLAALTLASGYADQAHPSRGLAGLPPRALIAAGPATRLHP